MLFLLILINSLLNYFNTSINNFNLIISYLIIINSLYQKLLIINSFYQKLLIINIYTWLKFFNHEFNYCRLNSRICLIDLSKDFLDYLIILYQKNILLKRIDSLEI